MSLSSKRLAKPLGVFSLAMITAGSVDSIRNLPATALFGSTLIFFFLIGALFFLLPSALVSAELASTHPREGGVYAWVADAFGERMGYLAVWFQWIENVIWYPTILSFLAGTVAYLFSPTLASNPYFLVTIIIVSFWAVTIINLLGINASALVANACSIFGLLLPMGLIIALGATWLLNGHASHIQLSPSHWLPHADGHQTLWIALTGVIMSFCGMEIATVHSRDVKSPNRDYPKAMLLATVIIVFTLMCGSLSIAAVLPHDKISLVAGIMQAFDAFFSAYHWHALLPVMALSLVVGGLGSVNNWIIAPARGISYALAKNAPGHYFSKESKRGVPARLLVVQAIIVSVVSTVFLLLPSVNTSYWLLTALAAQLYMLMYLILFVAAIVLRYRKHKRLPGFMIPGGKLGIWIVAGFGWLASLATFIVGFFPPSNGLSGSVMHYELLLISGLLVMSLIPLLLIRRKKS